MKSLYEETQIIISLTGSSAEACLREAKEAAPFADLLEWRADRFLSANPEAAMWNLLPALVPAAEKPLLFTLRTLAEGGSFDGGEEAYAGILRRAIACPDIAMIDLEYDRRETASLIKEAAAAGRGVCLSKHDFTGMPPLDALQDLLRQMDAAGCACVKLAVMPADRDEAEALLSLCFWAEEALQSGHCLIGMGQIDQTRTEAPLLSSRFSFASFKGRESAPGQIDARALRAHYEALRAPRMYGSLFLTGFMGTGKTLLGKLLSARLGIPLIETDREIERLTGQKIPELFKREGEAAFRRAEREVFRTLPADRAIISTGGGAVLSPSNILEMRKRGRVIRLEASAPTIAARLEKEKEGRPLAKAFDDPAAINALLSEREMAYRFAADLTVRTDGKAPNALTDEIILACDFD